MSTFNTLEKSDRSGRDSFNGITLQDQPKGEHPSQDLSKLEELIRRRREKVKLMKEDRDNSHETLAKLYGDSTHFITELLQNAEDEGATNVSFKLTDRELIFSHNAKKLFDLADIG